MIQAVKRDQNTNADKSFSELMARMDRIQESLGMRNAALSAQGQLNYARVGLVS